MKFTSLKLIGFKSFVDPTELLIEPGLTGIVGPNGCGKSNLLEAMRWVMGETSAKSMRGSGMEDVIFAGTSTRPARNMAEVRLTIDNTARRAPAAFNGDDALEISRRIEKDAGSCYRVNGRDLRAKDVQLFFADLSSGAHSPALVRQGQIGQLINAKPSDRRQILEEAAGISGLHSRRHEAELRLRAAESNLARVDDMLQQLQTQLASLKRQARQAGRYRDLSREIRQAEAIVLHLRWREAAEAVAAAEETLRQIELAVAARTQEAAAASRTQAEAAGKLPPLREAEAEAAAALHRLEVERDALDAEERRAREEEARLTAQLSGIAGDLERERAMIRDSERETARLTEERERLSAARAQEGEALAAHREKVEAARKDLTGREGELDELTRGIAAADARRAGLERTLLDLRKRRARIAGRIAEALAEAETLQAQAGDTSAADAADAIFRAAAARVEEAERHLAQTETTKEEAERSEAQAREPLQQADKVLSALNAEAKALRQVLRVTEGKLWPPVIDALTVTSGYETALGAALGDDLEAPLEEAAPAHWLTLEPLSEPPALPDGARALSEFVSAPAALARRLTQVGVVEAVEGAALQSALLQGQRLVSREGALWRWDGYTARADAPTAAAERLAQRNRVAELEAEITEAEARAARARANYHEAREAAQAMRTAEAEARRALRETQAALRQAQEGVTAAEREDSRHRARLATLEETVMRLRQEEAEAAQELDAPRLGLERLGDGLHLRGRLGALRDDVTAGRARLAEAQAAFDGLRRDAEARSRRLDEIAREITAWAERLKDAGKQIESLDKRRGEAEARLAEVRAVPEGLVQKRAALIAALDQAAEKRKLAADALGEAEATLAEADRRDRAAQKAMSDIREDRARSEARLDGARERLEDVIARIAEVMDCTPEKVLDMGGVEGGDLPPLHETEQRLEKLKRTRDSMGPVNLRADHETQEYQEQYDSMSAERGELDAAITKLRQGIANLNKEGRERLLAAFDVVNGHFKHLFTTLFSGGEAELQLVESEDPLEAGLEIMARPPGKRLQSMSLLSGGEQALTAMSLIFAVFLSNPAPICVLDEVDAPLDDTNVERFCNLLDEMVRATETRFIIITHHALTMSRMNRLYGVTMAERGVSQLVSVDLSTAEKVAAAV